MIKYIAKVGNKEKMKDGYSTYTYWSSPLGTRKEAQKFIDRATVASTYHHTSARYSNQYDCGIIEKVEVFHTDNKEEAEREGYKPFWINIWEESKYVKKWYAKDKDSLQTDWASDEIHDDFNEGQWHWKNGHTDWEIFDEKGLPIDK